MSRRRPLLTSAACVAVLLGAAAGPDARAGTRACKLFTDKQDDTFLARVQEDFHVWQPREPALDILSGDIAADSRTIAVVMRVAQLSRTVPTSPTGAAYRVQFTVPTLADDRNLFLEGRIDKDGRESFIAGIRNEVANSSTQIGLAAGVFDFKRNEVRVWTSMKQFEQRVAGVTLRKGTLIQLGNLDQVTSRYTGDLSNGRPGVGLFSDMAHSTSTYVAGSPSCLPVGR